jgi:hypothetical protein
MMGRKVEELRSAAAAVGRLAWAVAGIAAFGAVFFALGLEVGLLGAAPLGGPGEVLTCEHRPMPRSERSP